MSAFVLQIQDLDESGKDWSFAIGKEWLASALRDTDLAAGPANGRLDVHAQRNGADVLVDIALTALFSPEHTRVGEAQEIDVRLDEVSRDYYSGAMIELDSMVREYLLLEAPMKPLCSEGCEGIAVPEHLRPPEEVFGEAAPDARFAPLLKLKEELTKNEE
jgi:uncharacterized metal-binding protein YceD (DUF177 family)